MYSNLQASKSHNTWDIYVLYPFVWFSTNGRTLYLWRGFVIKKNIYIYIVYVKWGISYSQHISMPTIQSLDISIDRVYNWLSNVIKKTWYIFWYHLILTKSKWAQVFLLPPLLSIWIDCDKRPFCVIPIKLLYRIVSPYRGGDTHGGDGINPEEDEDVLRNESSLDDKPLHE